MNSAIRYGSAFIFICVTHVCFAEKVAVIDPLEAIANSKQGRAEQMRLKTEYVKEESKGIIIQDELKSLMDKYRRDARMMSVYGVRDLEISIKNKQLDLQLFSQQLQKRVNDSNRAVIKITRPSFQRALNKVVEDEGIDFVIQREAVLDFSSAIDITSKIVEEMDRDAGF